jgi:hypothetical protein
MKTENVTLYGTYTTSVGMIGAILLHIYKLAVIITTDTATTNRHKT